MKSIEKSPSLVALCILGLCVLSLFIGIVGQLFSGQRIEEKKASPKNDFISRMQAEDRLAYIALDGVISEGPDDEVFGASTSAASVLRKLRLAQSDRSVKGVLLRINSPGGTVGMSQELYQAVLKVRKRVPVVVSMGDLAASGGYYTASAASWIVSNKGTLTASIGVIIHSMNMEQLLKNKLGVQPVTIKSGQFKDILSPYRPATRAELSLLQNIIDQSYDQFLKDVQYGRTLRYGNDSAKKGAVADAIRSVADGRVVLGSDALNYHLVDSLGSNEDALAKLRELVGEQFKMNAENLVLDKDFNQPDFWDILSGSASSSSRWEAVQRVTGMLNKSTPNMDFKPATLRFANQPLWLMEGLN